MKQPRKESVERLFLALTEFYRLLGTKEAKTVNHFMNTNNVPVNLHSFIKKEMVRRHLVDKDFSAWSTERALPSPILAESLLIAAYSAFNEHKAERPSQTINKPSPISKDIMKHVDALKALGVKEVTLTF